MNKIQAVSIALLAISAASVANAATTGGSLTAASTIAVSTTDCPSLKEAVELKLSSANFGAVSCPNASTGAVAVANEKGKGISYSASSNGGALVELQNAAKLFAPGEAATAAEAAAVLASGASS